MTQVIGRFLSILIDRCASFQWVGWKRRVGIRGQLIAYETSVSGYTVKIAFFDCTDETYYPSWRDTRWVRGLTEKNTKWIEISVRDTYARYGRRMVLEHAILLPENHQYETVSLIFDEIVRVGRVFTVGKDIRLSEEEALLAFCKELEQQLQPV